MTKRQIRAKVILADLRAGLSDHELMEKHRISEKGLRSILKKLLTAGLISKENFAWRSVLWDDTVTIDLRDIDLGNENGFSIPSPTREPSTKD